MSALNISDYKKIIRERMGDYRFSHSVNVAKEAKKLAKHYGAVEDAAESKGTCARGADGAGQVRRLCVLRDDVSRLCHYGRKVRRAGRCRKKY